jgi:hypothetical protein
MYPVSAEMSLDAVALRAKVSALDGELARLTAQESAARSRIDDGKPAAGGDAYLAWYGTAKREHEEVEEKYTPLRKAIIEQLEELRKR